MTEWHYLKNGAQLGPISDEELLAKTAASEILAEDLIWKDGMADWVAASEVVDFETDTAAPAVATEEWYASIDDEQQGPYSLEQVGALYKDRTLKGDDVVWADSLPDWTPISEVAAFQGFKPVGLAVPARAAAKAAPKAKAGAQKKATAKKGGIKIQKKTASTRSSATNPYQAPSSKAEGNTDGKIDNRIVAELAATQPWVRFMSVLTFIPAIFMIIGGLGSFFVALRAGGEFFMTLIIGAVIYVILGIVMLYPAKRLWGYASSIQRLQISNSRHDLIDALRMQRQYWKFIGIAVIVYFALIIVLFMMGVAGASRF